MTSSRHISDVKNVDSAVCTTLKTTFLAITTTRTLLNETHSETPIPTLTLGVHAKSYRHRGTRGGGGRLMEPPKFLISCSITKRFCLQWKAFDLLYIMRDEVYFMGGSAAGSL